MTLALQIVVVPQTLSADTDRGIRNYLIPGHRLGLKS
jgi:hypothetical protein